MNEEVKENLDSVPQKKPEATRVLQSSEETLKSSELPKRKRGRPRGAKGKKHEGKKNLLLSGTPGRKSMFGRDLTAIETLRFDRMVALADKDPEAAMEKFNVFGPELEARKWVEALVEAGGSLVKAVRRMVPWMKDKPIEECYRYGIRVVEGARIKELLKQELDSAGVSIASIVNRVNNIADAPDAKYQDKLRALEILGKFKQLGEGGDSVKGDKVTYNLNISEDAARRLLERRNRYDIGAGGRFNGQGDSECHVVDGEEVIDGLHDTDAEGVSTELAS